MHHEGEEKCDAEDQSSSYNHTDPLSQLCQKMVSLTRKNRALMSLFQKLRGYYMQVLLLIAKHFISLNKNLIYVLIN